MKKPAKIHRKSIISLMLVILLCQVSAAHGWSGKVVDILEGDTLAISLDGTKQTIRLFGVDCPERGQPFFENARVLTTHMTNQRTVEVTPIYTDSDQIVNALVRLDGVREYVNEQLISYGMAWIRPNICTAKVCEEWRKLELMARQNTIGIWAEMNPIPPWEFKIQKRLKIREGSQEKSSGSQ